MLTEDLFLPEILAISAEDFFFFVKNVHLFREGSSSQLLFGGSEFGAVVDRKSCWRAAM
jgi:hypothetical protein